MNADETTAFAQLTADVAAEATVEQSAITLINGIPGIVQAALTAAGLDPADVVTAVNAVDASVKANSAPLAAAVAANTPAAAPAA